MSSQKFKEPYTPLLKGYLTYDASPIINGIFLREQYHTNYKVTIDDVVLFEPRISDNLQKEIETIGGSVEKIKTRHTYAKNEIFGIPVVIRKINKKGKLLSIQIRVTGNTTNEILNKIEIIKSKLSEYKIKPKECLWDRSIL